MPTATEVMGFTYEVGMSANIKKEVNPLPYVYERKRYGDGPFPVVKVEEVPPRSCTCFSMEPESLDPNDHYPECEMQIPSNVGHHQWVTLNVHGEEHQFSGKLLEPAPAKE